MNCPVHRARMIICCWLCFFSLHNYVSFIIVSVCVAFIFHLIITKFTLYPLLDYTLYPIVPVYLLQAYNAHISRPSIYLHIV